MKESFHKIAHSASEIFGSPWAFILAVMIIMLWALSGAFFGFSDSWQLIINTGTTILTFLMVFLIQNTQNRDAKAIHLKLDILIKSKNPKQTRFVDLEDMTEQELDQLQDQFKKIRNKFLNKAT